MTTRPKLLTLRKRLIDEQRRLIDLVAGLGALPSAGELQRIGDLESAITAVEAMLEEGE